MVIFGDAIASKDMLDRSNAVDIAYLWISLICNATFVIAIISVSTYMLVRGML